MSVNLKPIADGEWSNRTLSQEGLYVAIDMLGTKRNICTAIQSGTEITKSTSKVATLIAGGVVPISFVLGGGLIMASAVRDILPRAHQEYAGAREEYSVAKKGLRDARKLKDFNEIKLAKVKMKLAEEGLAVAKLGMTNASLAGAMGVGMTATGASTLASSLMNPAGAGLFGAHVVSSAAATTAAATATQFCGGALGLIYTVRGPVVISKAFYNLSYLNQFEKNFKRSLKLNNSTLNLRRTVDGAIEMANFKQSKASKEPTKENLEESVDRAIEMIEQIGTGTTALMRRIGENANLKEDASLSEKIKYLEEVDKGIHEKKLQQKVSLIIGFAMLFGGLASLVTTALLITATGGLAVPVIGLISAISFTAMEGIFATYDSSYLFGKFKDYCYSPSKEIAAIQELHRKIEWEEAKQARRASSGP